jgi:hypothetical protein
LFNGLSVGGRKIENGGPENGVFRKILSVLVVVDLL